MEQWEVSQYVSEVQVNENCEMFLFKHNDITVLVIKAVIHNRQCISPENKTIRINKWNCQTNCAPHSGTAIWLNN